MTHSGSKRSRFTGSAQCETHLANVGDFLLPRRVEQWLEFFTLAHVLGVGHYADDLDFAFAVNNGDSFAEHVVVWKELTREGLIDDSYFGRVLVIFRREAAPAQQWDFHRREIVFTHRLPVGDVFLPGSHFRLARK